MYASNVYVQAVTIPIDFIALFALVFNISVQVTMFYEFIFVPIVTGAKEATKMDQLKFK